jgi:hypothetical protein
MPKQNFAQLAFNRGVVSPLGLGRIDQETIVWAAEEMTNIVPRVLGSAMLRTGTEYIGRTKDNLKSYNIPFVFSSNDQAIIELTNNAFRVRVNEKIIVRNSVSTTILNGNFALDLSNWTNNDETGAASSYANGFLQLLGTGTNKAIRTQEVLVNIPDLNIEHGVRIIISRGEVVLKIGSSQGNDDYVSETTLGRGVHSLSVTPSNSFWIELSSDLNYATLIESVTIETAGDMIIPTTISENDFSLVRYDNSGDIIYLAVKGQQQRKIERRDIRSWSFVYYEPKDGPFLLQNVSNTTIESSGLKGNVVLTSSRGIFKKNHVGALFKLTSFGQTVTADLTAENSYTDSIRVTGVGTSRVFFVVITGTWQGKITLQRSLDEGSSWEDVNNFTSNTNPTSSPSINYSLDNQIVFYRIGFNYGNYTSGTATVSLQYSSGSITGIARITSYTSSTVVNAEVLKDFGSTDPTNDWAEGVWSNYRGYPSAISFHEGRLWFAGNGRYIGSVSDNYESFDENVEGDSGLINKAIGDGAVEEVNWLLSSDVLALGTSSGEKIIRSNTFGDILTPFNTSIKTLKNIGSTNISPVLVDQRMIFAFGSFLYEIYTLSTTEGGIGFDVTNLTLLSPEICKPNITQIAVQRRPDTRIHCLRSDGKVAIMVYNVNEGIKSWSLWETDGIVENILITKGGSENIEDVVYYTIIRTINGQNQRYLEKWAYEDNAQGGVINEQLDSFKKFSLDVSSDTLSGLEHLANRSVKVWDGTSGQGKFLGNFNILNSGNLELGQVVNNCIVGLSYTGRIKSMKLPYASGLGTPLNQKKMISMLGVILHNTIVDGVKIGTDDEYLNPMPCYEDGYSVDENHLYTHYDKEMFPIDGTYTTDPRLIITAQSPYPFTLLALTATIQTNDKG